MRNFLEQALDKVMEADKKKEHGKKKSEKYVCLFRKLPR